MSVWKWGVDFVTTLIGWFMGDSFWSGANLFGKFVLMTPQMIDLGWVRLPWLVVVITSIFLTLTFIAVGIFLMYYKNDAEIDWGQSAKVVAVAIFVSTVSIFLVDLSIYGHQKVFEAGIQPVLVREYKQAGSASIITEEGLEDDEISFSSFDTASLLLLSFGADFEVDETSLTDPQDTLSSGVLGVDMTDSTQQYVDASKEPYEYFLVSNGGDGGITMVFAFGITWLMGVIGLMRVAVLGILAAGGPLWTTYAIYSMKLDTLASYALLVELTILVGYLFQVGWVLAVLVARSDIGFGAQTAVVLLYTVMLLATLFFWMRLVIWAVRQPITLAGKKVSEKYGETVASLGETFADTGQFFGFQKMQKAGDEMQIHGNAVQQFGEDLGNINGNLLNHLDALHEAERYKHFEEASRVKSFLGTSFGSAVEKSEYAGVSAMGMSDKAFMDLLQENGLDAVTEVDGDEIFVKEDYLDQAEEILKRNYVQENLMDFDYDGTSGKVVMNEAVLEAVEETAAEKDLELTPVVYMDIDRNGALEKMHKEYKAFRPIDMKKDKPFEMPDGRIGINLDDDKRYRDIVSTFDTFGVEYTEGGGGTLFFDGQSYDGLDEKFKALSELKDLGVASSHEAIYNTEDEREIHEADRVKELLTMLSVDFEDLDTVFIGDEDVDDSIDSLLETTEGSLHVKEDKRYVSFKMDSAHAYAELRDELYAQLPAGSILTETMKSKRRHEILVDQAFSAEAIRTIKAYDNKQPYWLDDSGQYICKHKDVGYVLENAPPEDGRFMGPAPINIRGGIAS